MPQFRIGLARAVRAEEREDLSVPHLEIDARDRLVTAVALDQPAHADHRGLPRHLAAAVVSGLVAGRAARAARASADSDAMCRATNSGTVATGISASGSSVIGALDGVTCSSENPVRAPRVRATVRSVRPNTVNHSATRRPAPRASLRATNGAAIPVAMSPRPAGSANSAGRWPRAR